MFEYKRTLLIVLSVSFVFSLYYFAKNAVHAQNGDGFEYAMMTEGFSNHATPDLRAEDLQKHIEFFEKNKIKYHNETFYRSSLEYLKKEPSFYGYYQSPRNGRFYAYHFWTSSLFAAPFRVILDLISGDIRLAYLMLNLFLIHLGIWILFGISFLKLTEKFFGASFLVFSPIAWYVHWPHSEVFSGVLCFLAVLLFFDNKKYVSLLFLALASTQAQPIVVAALYVFLDILISEKRDWKALLKLFFVSVWVIVPPLFYLYLFSKPSLNFGDSFTDLKFISINRLYSYFYDLNQGMVIGIPLVLISLKGFLIRDIFYVKLLTFLKTYSFVICLLLMSPLFMITINWNHGSSVINRYAVWGASMVMATFLYRLSLVKSRKKYFFFGLVAIVQIATISSQIDYNKNVWYSARLNALSKYMLYNYPSFYSPDPQIFVARTYYNRPLYKQELSSTDSVMTFTDNKYRIKKMLIREGAIGQLVLRGISQEKIDSLSNEMHFYNGYSYLNIDKLEQIGYNQKEDTLINYIEREKMNKLKSDYFEKYRAIDSSKGPLEEEKLIKSFQKELIEYEKRQLNDKRIDFGIL